MNKENAQMHFRIALALAVALLSIAFAAPVANAGYEDFALESSEASLSNNQAGAHADFETKWIFTKDKTEDDLS